MSKEEFLAWEMKQPEKWEHVDGFPVLRRVRMVAGGTINHGAACARLITALGSRLRGNRCIPLTSDVRVETGRGSSRYPDVTVDCGPRRPGQMDAREPVAIFEVISPSNTFRQQLRLIEDYKFIASVQHIVFVSQTDAAIVVWSRSGPSWDFEELEGRESTLRLGAVGVEIPLAEIYEDIVFDAAPEAGTGARRSLHPPAERRRRATGSTMPRPARRPPDRSCAPG
jgi:Uma2 family endonuclease